jgi:sugar O-acyltransferase (sialic acid O-acetyltransferase NeuD family)
MSGPPAPREMTWAGSQGYPLQASQRSRFTQFKSLRSTIRFFLGRLGVMSAGLIILGAGGFAKEVFDWFMHARGYEATAFYDDEPREKMLMGRPVLSSFEGLAGSPFLVAVGDPETREKLVESAKFAGLVPSYPLVHPTVVIGRHSVVESGAILCPGVVLGPMVQVGDFAILNLHTTVGHDSQVGAYATLSPGVNVSGNVQVGRRAYVGTNAAIREGLSVGDASVVGMGSVVVRSVPAGARVMGNPARQQGVQGVASIHTGGK